MHDRLEDVCVMQWLNILDDFDHREDLAIEVDF